MPPVLSRLFSGTLWLALRIPLQILFSLWTIPLIFRAIGDNSGAYGFAWGFGFFQMLFEFGMSSALQRQVTDRWTRGDRDGVDRAIACGMNFYAVMALVQMAALVGVAYVALPFSRFVPGTPAYALIVKLLWLQVATAPFYGLSAVLSSVLQAARRYDFMPRLELGVVTLRFAILWAGVHAGVDFYLIVVAQTLSQIALVIVPALWVMVHELGHVPHFRGARRDDYRALVNISFYMFLVQLSVVLADRVDTTILGFAADDPAHANKVYMAVSKPFLQIRQTGWTLAYLVMPAVASLVAARDEKALERITYDGTRLHVGLILPVALLAFVYAPPFLTLWVGDTLGADVASAAPLLRLFLVATIPLVLSVPVQAAFGMGKVRAVALAALGGSLVNLPLSYVLTRRLGVAGVIWGTVLTTLFSNLLIPGVYVFRALNVRPATLARRTLSAPLAGALALLAAAAAVGAAFPLHPSPRGGMALARWAPLAAHLTVCCLAYAAGYLAVPVGRGDLAELAGKLRSRVGRAQA
jgi:O-antigen/teichoic acid export membrane protein